MTSPKSLHQSEMFRISLLLACRTDQTAGPTVRADFLGMVRGSFRRVMLSGQ